MSSSNGTRPVEVFRPGVYIRDELEARGWSQLDLAEILGRPPRLVSELIGGTRAVSPETAKGLSAAFGTSAELWMNLQTAYDLWRFEKSSDHVARRARLYSIAPIRDMIKRGWIEDSESIDLLEKQVADFFEIPSVEHDPKLAVATRTSLATRTTAQVAWFFRAKRLGRAVEVRRFTSRRLEGCMARLRSLMTSPEESRDVPRVLGEAGVRFVVVEPLPRSRIDGASIWLDGDKPVIALSMRYDRIDWFWHTLLHEIEHVRRRHNVLDVDIAQHRDDEKEEEADRAAQESLIPESRLDDFVARVRPFFSHRNIRHFAASIGVHPGIVVGQLQYRGEIPYAHSRGLLAKVREHVVRSALTDGWGSVRPVRLQER